MSEATAVLVGDVSFLHDINGLQLASQVSRPLVVVVVNNGGGRIFEQLPIARQGREEWLPYFTTPHEASVAGAASIYGCAFRTVSAVSDLRTALEAAYADLPFVWLDTRAGGDFVFLLTAADLRAGSR